MRTIGNIIWFVFGGFFWAAADFIAGIICCITIIGIPLGLQLFKFAGFVIWPFGKQVTPVSPSGLKAVLNIIWLILAGWYYALVLNFCISL